MQIFHAKLSKKTHASPTHMHMANSQENVIGACVNMHIWCKPRAFTQRKMQNDQQHDNFVSDIPTEQLSDANQYAHDLFWAKKHDLSCGVKQ